MSVCPSVCYIVDHIMEQKVEVSTSQDHAVLGYLHAEAYLGDPDSSIHGMEMEYCTSNGSHVALSQHQLSFFSDCFYPTVHRTEHCGSSR